MKILPKKQKQRLIIQLFEKIIEIVPDVLIAYIISKIGTYFGWNPTLIVTTITAIVGSNHISINISIDSKKTN